MFGFTKKGGKETIEQSGLEEMKLVFENLQQELQKRDEVIAALKADLEKYQAELLENPEETGLMADLIDIKALLKNIDAKLK